MPHTHTHTWQARTRQHLGCLADVDIYRCCAVFEYHLGEKFECVSHVVTLLLYKRNKWKCKKSLEWGESKKRPSDLPFVSFRDALPVYFHPSINLTSHQRYILNLLFFLMCEGQRIFFIITIFTYVFWSHFIFFKCLPLTDLVAIFCKADTEQWSRQKTWLALTVLSFQSIKILM